MPKTLNIPSANSLKGIYKMQKSRIDRITAIINDQKHPHPPDPEKYQRMLKNYNDFKTKFKNIVDAVEKGK